MSTAVSNDTPDAAEPKAVGGLNSRVVLNAVRRRPLPLAGVVALAGVAAAVVWFLLPLPKLTAVMVFHISSHIPVVLPGGQVSGPDPASYRQTQATLIKRHLTLNNALKEPGVSSLKLIRSQGDPVAWLDRSLRVDVRSGTEFMKVSIEGDDPDELRAILAAVAKAYLEDVDDREKGQQKKKMAFLHEQHKEKQQELEQSQNQIRGIVNVIGSPDMVTLNIFETLLQNRLQAAGLELESAQEQLQLVESALAKLREAAVAGEGPAPAAGAVDEELARDLARDTEFQQLEAVVTRQRKTVADTEALVRPEDRETSPRVRAARAELKTAEEKRDAYRDGLRPRVEARLKRALAQDREKQAATLEGQAEQARQRAERAQGKVDAVQGDIRRLNGYRSDLETLKRNITQAEQMSATLAGEIERAKVELGAPSRVTLSDEPFVVSGLEGNRRMKFAPMAAVGTFLAGFAGLVALEHRGRRVTSTDEVTTGLGMRLIGTIPPHAGSQPEPAAGPSVLVESIDTARTMLLHGNPAGPGLRTLLVTSAVSGEGKTTLSGHLAISLTRAGYRTLLIDGDLQAPSVHALFGLDGAPGLCELLRGEVEVADAVRPTAVPGLSVMPAGQWTLATRQMLMGDRWRAIKEQVEARFDFVVVDSSPLLLVSDTLLLAREADGVVLSVLLGVSHVTHVAETAARLRTVGAQLTGVVVNGVSSEVYGAADRYGSRYSATRPRSSPETGVGSPAGSQVSRG
jgi:succinoglycan biosynthesis transport protein ExoP